MKGFLVKRGTEVQVWDDLHQSMVEHEMKKDKIFYLEDMRLDPLKTPDSEDPTYVFETDHPRFRYMLIEFNRVEVR